MWRIENLYYILDKKGDTVLFQPNEAQRKLLRRMWHRNIVPKARQRGFSTLIQHHPRCVPLQREPEGRDHCAGPVHRVQDHAQQGVPNCGLTIARQKLINGEYAGNPDVLLGTILKPPVLAALAMAEWRLIREDLMRKRETAATLSEAAARASNAESDEGTCRDPEARARVRWHIAEKEKQTPALPPSPKQVEMSEKITALPATEHHCRANGHCRRVQADIDAVMPEVPTGNLQAA
ncbi:hypothetical protein AU381_01720 [Sinorhizobium glycinis]|uniref:Uncharacterized protein n=2 Tax=Sinorhizobium glycinis TaxID=1472378 RepID=A0A178Y0N4_9HYPH|nr:hypothetical protein AU381_01720 [Sinorhizobium glycinis]